MKRWQKLGVHKLGHSVALVDLGRIKHLSVVLALRLFLAPASPNSS